jgi:hypothetical protein
VFEDEASTLEGEYLVGFTRDEDVLGLGPSGPFKGRTSHFLRVGSTVIGLSLFLGKQDDGRAAALTRFDIIANPPDRDSVPHRIYSYTQDV